MQRSVQTDTQYSNPSEIYDQTGRLQKRRKLFRILCLTRKTITQIAAFEADALPTIALSSSG